MPDFSPHIRQTAPAIRVFMGENIGIHRSVLRLLGNPPNLQFWWSDARKTLLLGACPAYSPGAVCIPARYYKTSNGCVFTNRSLMRAIGLYTGWPDGSKHKIIGSFLPEQNMVAFSVGGKNSEVHYG